MTHKFGKAKFVARLRFDAFVDIGTWHMAKVETLEQFKGAEIDSLRINSQLHTSCAYLPPEGSEWLIFASEFKGELVISSCSGGILLELSGLPGSKRISSGKRNEANNKLEILRYFKDNKLPLTSYSGGGLGLGKDFRDKFSGYEGQSGEFAVYTFKMKRRGRASSVKFIRPFSNRKLTRDLKRYLKNGLKNERLLTVLPRKRRIAGLLLFSPARREFPSSVSSRLY